MNKQILYITEHLRRLLSTDQLRCIEQACQFTSFQVNSEAITLPEFVSIESPNVILATEQCLVFLLQTKDFSPKSNFIIFGMHKEDIPFTQYKEKIRGIRFILGDPPLQLLETILIHTLRYFAKDCSENIVENFNQQNSISVSFELTNSKERDDMQQKIKAFFQEQINKNKSSLTVGASVYAKNLADILEEFLMNAIWDANPKYATLDRTKPLELLEHEKVNILCLFDGIHLILSVTDLFGSFTSKAIEKHIQASLGVKAETQIHEGEGGAGIGLFMILQKIGVLVFEVEKGKATRATAIARGDQSFRDMQKKSRTLLFFEK